MWPGPRSAPGHPCPSRAQLSPMTPKYYQRSFSDDDSNNSKYHHNSRRMPTAANRRPPATNCSPTLKTGVARDPRALTPTPAEI